MSTTEKLCAMINERAEAGLKKYGVTVDRKDLTADQWLQHAIEEMLDGAAYLMRLREEIRNMEREQIGLLKAVGYDNAMIAWHYIKLVLAIALLGIVIG